MPIREISVVNFKSFREIRIEPDCFNIIIGSNASGKSNLIQIFKFIRDIAKYGLNNAISLQGGVEYLRNTTIGPAMPFSFRILYLLEEKRRDVIAVKEGLPIYFEPYEILYEFSLSFSDSGDNYEISRDLLVITGTFSRPGTHERCELGMGRITLAKADHSVAYAIVPPDTIELRDQELFPQYFQKHEIPSRWLIMNLPIAVPGIPPLEWLFRGMKVFDFDPLLLKRAVPIVGKTELEKDGGNLAIVIKNILEDPHKKTEFLRLIREMLPFIEEVAIEKFMDMSLFLKLKETYSSGKYIPASMISDGTINILALIIALYFEKRPVTVIEEPERNIHPFLISQLVEMLKDAARTKQIIVTTHNPEMVKHADLEDILLISRDRSGFSQVIRPGTKKEIRTFLEHEIGIEDLFIQNLLGME
ncbi:MAG TPA: AAA family ATPase [Methanoregulaceae archaeon]|nr:MAG: AAA family ATPase [Methanolinea sp.]HON82129.1 AAA family ATPase [Methanoregulaceae archaeon]HPD10829.1 AAA family ATPase [Methanoregulaceae archaeon]HRT16015.1 AAA family ATPase [Methanoregulaceae archaeon]HRU31480.1 AAA family ATPase [Methanoregulaceae archaeon]